MRLTFIRETCEILRPGEATLGNYGNIQKSAKIIFGGLVPKLIKDFRSNEVTDEVTLECMEFD